MSKFGDELITSMKQAAADAQAPVLGRHGDAGHPGHRHRTAPPPLPHVLQDGPGGRASADEGTQASPLGDGPGQRPDPAVVAGGGPGTEGPFGQVELGAGVAASLGSYVLCNYLKFGTLLDGVPLRYTKLYIEHPEILEQFAFDAVYGAFSGRGQIEGRDLGLPMLDINTVSAGGGTIARVDRFGMLQVGPHSAGAVPGPACYGRGGEKATITDCNLVLGYVGKDNFLGGRMRLELERAEAVIAAKVARPLGLEVVEAAEGVVRVIDVKMEEAIKAISPMRGHDLRDFMLLAFGGAGPLHA